ncbi:MAG: UpxY family transcription antiterminator [Ferruginibacter sp.]|nr:UpxY family transcription antiterminator [Ferruginibacter sp.]
MSNSTKKWYALYTKPGTEKKVANLFSRRNIENYCPLTRQCNGRKREVMEPLFSSYVFVQIEEKEIKHIRISDSILNFVYWLGKPAVIQDEEIEIMKRFMNEYSNVKLEKIPFGVNGMVRVIGGSPADNKTQMVSVMGNTVKIVLPSLGYMLLAEVEKANVAIITAAKQPYTIVDKYQFAI